MNISLPTASPGSVPGERHPRQQFQRHGWCQCPRDKRGGITHAGGLDTTLTARECWFWCSRAKEGQDSLDLAAHCPQSPAVTRDGGRGVLSPAFRFQLGHSPWITGTPEPPRALQRPCLKGDNPKVSFPSIQSLFPAAGSAEGSSWTRWAPNAQRWLLPLSFRAAPACRAIPAWNLSSLNLRLCIFILFF